MLDTPQDKLPVRHGVVAVFFQDNHVMAFERSDVPASWQFPQGGIEEGESPLEALQRETLEECGSGEFELVHASPTATTYRIPPEIIEKKKLNFSGQSQRWFLLRWKPGQGPDLEKSDGEFKAWKWMDPDAFLQQIVFFKRESYEEGLHLLGVLS